MKSKAWKVFLLQVLPDKIYLKMKYKRRMGKALNLKSPKTYNEKLQWLKLYDRKPIYTTMVDKYEVKQYVAKRIGEEYIIPTLGVWDSFDEIDFNILPNQFVLKCTHDSGGVVICKNKAAMNIDAARELLSKSLKRNFYWNGREWPYKNIKPRILAEAYLEDTKTQELRDYKYFVFGGEAKALFIATGRQTEDKTRFDYFDMDYNHMELRRKYPNAEVLPEKPKCFELMRALAQKLGEGIPHVRVDFYEVDGKVYFGELTFFQGSGMAPFYPDYWDEVFGAWIQLPTQES